jgi:predicted dehydrogenase
VAQACGARAVAGIDELLACDLDAVYIATPAHRHLGQVLACARAGKHVLCEKPLGLAVAEAETMISACRKAGVRLGTALMMRFHSQHRAALELIEQGRLGRPVFARAQLSCWYPPIPDAWRQDPATGGGGALMDLGGHCIDLLEMFFGPVKAVSCAINRIVQDYPVEDGAVTTLEFQNGAIGTVDTFFCIPDESSRNVLELYGSEGSILASGTIGQGDKGKMTAYLRNDPAGYNAQQARAGAAGLAIEPPPVNLYRAEIEEFGRALSEDREPVNNGQIGWASQRVLAACYVAAHTRRTVELGGSGAA